MAVADLILETARSWIGTPYRKGRLERGKAVDCLNFAGGVYMERGLILRVPSREYRLRWWEDPSLDLIADGIEEGMQHLADGVQCVHVTDGYQPGDLLELACLPEDPRATHVAFLEEVRPHLQNIIHARQGPRGKVERTRRPPQWRIIGARRLLVAEDPAP